LRRKVTHARIGNTDLSFIAKIIFKLAIFSEQLALVWAWLPVKAGS
jgi:hypothetical protein